MKVKKIVIALIVLAIIAGGAFYFINKNNDKSSTGQSSTESASINDLLAKGDNLTCKFTYSNSKGDTNSGTVFISGNRSAGDFTYKGAKDKQSQKSHVITSGQDKYYWGEGYGYGYKTKTSLDAQNKTPNQKYISLADKYDYSCSSWNTDDSVFNLPKNIHFFDQGQNK